MTALNISCFWSFVLFLWFPIFNEVIQRRVMKSHRLSPDWLSPAHRLSNFNKTKTLASIKSHFGLNFSFRNFNPSILVNPGKSREIYYFDFKPLCSTSTNISFLVDLTECRVDSFLAALYEPWNEEISNSFQFLVYRSKEWKSIPLSS